MKNNPLYHFFYQFRGKISSSIYIPFLGKADRNHLALLRNLEKEMEVDKCLDVPLNKLNVVIFDFETTGFYPEKGDSILSIGAIKIINGQMDTNKTFYSLVYNERRLPDEIKQLTGIDESELLSAPPIADVLIQFYQFVQNAPLVAHHANHEKKFLQHANWKTFKKMYSHRIIDTSLVFNIANPDKSIVSLDDYCAICDIQVQNRHHALGDAITLAKLWQIYIQKLKLIGCTTLKDVYEQLAMNN
ncbi:exonuclease domain-containing protein [Pallidibacillus thermolactis]|uniref:exonuclease domain-containing protein n=1 Tax=Pallidibacillus thermolactis TaxID=251051 RepID=UPI002E1D6712|nr:exonuclease domain-containing protein [Pallidibacillus thermolactis]MED1673550.1 exonuclease domain-containing protein [Pallidibacillus thermolactis subsp. kokeshiiformis]